MDITVNSRWTSDCCGKQDLDFPIIDTNTRYWPDYSASCEIVFLDNFCINAKVEEDPYVESDYKPVTLAESGIIYGKSEADVKEKIRQWYNDHVVEALEKALKIIKEG